MLAEGAALTEAPVTRPPAPMIGHVTSSYWSATLGQPIALALLRNGRARIGDVVYVPSMDGRNHAVTVTVPSFVGKDAVDG